MSLTTRAVGPVTIFDLGEVLTHASAEELRSELRRAADGAPHWIVNLEAVDYIDSAGLGAIIDGYAWASRQGGSLKLLHPRPRAQYLLALTGLSNVMESFDSEEAALASFPREAQ
jgi:anti-sigma B factor antagonist